MFRLILIAAFICVMAVTVTAVLNAYRAFETLPTGKDDTMPPTRLSRITYALLLVLLFGLTTGLLGGA